MESCPDPMSSPLRPDNRLARSPLIVVALAAVNTSYRCVQ